MPVDTFTVSATGKATITKDPDAVLDYTFDWSEWLAAVTDTISSIAVDVASGVTPASSIAVSSSSHDGLRATVWVSGGVPGETAALRCRITTTASPSRTDDRTVYLKVKER